MVMQGQEGVMQGTGSKRWSGASLGASDGPRVCLHVDGELWASRAGLGI